MSWLLKAFRWLIGEVWEKINLPAVYRSLKELGKKYGRRFFWAAIIWEIIEDVLFPLLSWWFGVPELIPLFLVFHFEPIAYPVIFWLFRMYDRSQGIETWEPDRKMQSSNWRSAAKVAIYKIALVGWFIAILNHFSVPMIAVALYVLLMAGFGFIHERIWHDSNYGIVGDTDDIQFRRVFVKGITYRVVSAMTMYPLLKALKVESLWVPLISCQVVGFGLYLAFEALWSRSDWGMSMIEHEV